MRQGSDHSVGFEQEEARFAEIEKELAARRNERLIAETLLAIAKDHSQAIEVLKSQSKEQQAGSRANLVIAIIALIMASLGVAASVAQLYVSIAK